MSLSSQSPLFTCVSSSQDTESGGFSFSFRSVGLSQMLLIHCFNERVEQVSSVSLCQLCAMFHVGRASYSLYSGSNQDSGISPRYFSTMLIRSGGPPWPFSLNGMRPDRSFKIVTPNAQISLAGLGRFPMATSGGRNPG